MNHRFKTRLAAAAAVALVALGGVAHAQPGPIPGRTVSGGLRDGDRGAEERQLNLNTSQQAMWDSAVAAGNAARATARANMQKRSQRA